MLASLSAYPEHEHRYICHIPYVCVCESVGPSRTVNNIQPITRSRLAVNGFIYRKPLFSALASAECRQNTCPGNCPRYPAGNLAGPSGNANCGACLDLAQLMSALTDACEKQIITQSDGDCLAMELDVIIKYLYQTATRSWRRRSKGSAFYSF